MHLITTTNGQPATLDICNTRIRRDHAGRYCLNDLHKAAVETGANARSKEPGKFMASPQTEELIHELTDTQNPGVASVSAIRGGPEQGTYVCKELVYAYAMWISPSFNLKVIRAFDALVSAPAQAINPAELSRMQLIELAMQAEQERIALEHKVVEMAPKAAALDRIATADGSLCLMDAAKELQMRPKDLIAFMSAHQWIYKRAGGSAWIGYQDRIQSGLLEHKSNIVIDGAGIERIRDQVRVTAKGITRLAEVIEKEAA